MTAVDELLRSSTLASAETLGAASTVSPLTEPDPVNLASQLMKVKHLSMHGHTCSFACTQKEI